MRSCVSSRLLLLHRRRSSPLVAPRRGLIWRSKQRFPPGESPRPPPSREAREAKRDFTGSLIDDRRWGIVAAARPDDRPCIAVMGRDEMENELFVIRRERLELVVIFHVRQ